MRQGEADNAAAVRNERLLIIVSFEVNGYARSRLGDDGQAVVVNLIDIRAGLVAVPVTTNVPCMVTRLASSPTYSALTAVYVPAVRSSCTVNAPFASLVTIALLPPSGTVEIAIRYRFGRAADRELVFTRRHARDGDVYILLGHVQVFNHRRGYARLRRARNRRRRYTCPPRDFQS